MKQKSLYILFATVVVFLCTVNSAAQLEGRPQSQEVSGVVTSRSGTPISNATVTLRNRDNGKVFSATTDFNGRYKIRDLETGRYDVTVEQSGFAKRTFTDVSISGGQNQLPDFVFDDTQPVITVGAAVVVKGIVRSVGNSRPIKNAEISIKDKNSEESWSATTDDDGKYEKDLPPGEYRMTAKADGFRSSNEQVVTLRRGTKTQNFKLVPDGSR